MLMNLLTLIVFLIMFTILVAVHELGHFLAARRSKMGVSEFAIGLGSPIVWVWKRKKYKLEDGSERETLYTIRPLPLGGFVKILGMEPQEDGSEVDEVGGFYRGTIKQRIVTLLAGPVFSIVFGWLVLVGLYTTVGVESAVPRIDSLFKTQPAQVAGLLPGDWIRKVGDKPVVETQDALIAIRHSNGKPLTFTIERDGQMLTKTVTPTLSKIDMPVIDDKGEPTGKMDKQYQIGMSFGVGFQKTTPVEGFVRATMAPFEAAKSLVVNLTKPKQLVEESTGVIGMVVTTRMAVESGAATVFSIMGLISISLGYVNLLPLGFLDGGQILIAVIEGFRRGKRVSMKFQYQFMVAGALLLLGFFVTVMYKDILRFILPGEQNLLQGKERLEQRLINGDNAPAANNAPTR